MLFYGYKCPTGKKEVNNYVQKQIARRASISIKTINHKRKIARRALTLNQICICPTDNQ